MTARTRASTTARSQSPPSRWISSLRFGAPMPSISRGRGAKTLGGARCRYHRSVSRPDPPLSFAELEQQVRGRAIDTVLVAMTDMQGRLQGKRCAAEHFMHDVAARGAEACNYLLGVD